MPQFDPTWFASQIFWLVVVFVILYFLLARVALPRIGEVLEERQDKIEDDLQKAESLKREADGVLEEYEKALAEARGKAQVTLKEASDAIAAETAKRNQAFGEQMAKKTGEAEARIEAAKQKAIGNIRQVAEEVAIAATGKLIGAKVGAEEAAAAVKAAGGSDDKRSRG
jgi:F-type H+-transporting ATPase subunit b